MKTILYLCLASMINVCGSWGTAQAQTGFADYLGRPVSDLARRIGAPFNAYRDSDGWLVFQWDIGPTEGTVLHGLFLRRGSCLLEVASRPATMHPRPITIDWIIESWRFRGAGCI
jgi:hypothetical protein